MSCGNREEFRMTASQSITAIPVFYNPRMVADAQSFSPSAGKPAKVVESGEHPQRVEHP